MVRMVQSLPESVHFGSASKAAFCTATAASAPVLPDAEWSVASARFCVKKTTSPIRYPNPEIQNRVGQAHTTGDIPTFFWVNDTMELRACQFMEAQTETFCGFE